MNVDSSILSNPVSLNDNELIFAYRWDSWLLFCVLSLHVCVHVSVDCLNPKTSDGFRFVFVDDVFTKLQVNTLVLFDSRTLKITDVEA